MKTDIVAVSGSTALTAMTEAELIDVLQSSLYPGAALKSIKMVIGYCKAANLDPMQKPVHIVPMWDKNAKAMRDVIMPGVGLYRTQAARSNALAGIGEPEFGPTVDIKLDSATFSVPEWCRVVVKRLLPTGAIGEFAAIEYWIENYATSGKDSIQPNAMWKKRPRGQLAKCAQAQALRMAFPEMTGSAPTADEMEGKSLDASEVDVTPPSRNAKPAEVASRKNQPAQSQLSPELLANAQAAADQGRESFKAYWKAIRPVDRAALRDEVADLEERVKSAESRTIDAEEKPKHADAPPPADDEFAKGLDAAGGDYVPE